jgi:UPF0716 protein FxsA
MVSRLFLVYVIAELAVVVALASTIGLGWTLLLLMAAFAAGLALAGSQLKLQLTRLRSGLSADQPRLAADTMAVASGTLLMVVPGLLTSAGGLLLLLPPTRAAARPFAGRDGRPRHRSAVPADHRRDRRGRPIRPPTAARLHRRRGHQRHRGRPAGTAVAA